MPMRYFRRFRDHDSGTSAVEFALISPIFIVLLLGIICFSAVLSTYNAVQQIAAEAARAALPGLSAAEQSQLAQNYVTSVIGNYGLLDPSKLTVSTSAQATTFTVTATYNMSGSFFMTLGGFLVTASPLIIRSAAIQTGGF